MSLNKTLKVIPGGDEGIRTLDTVAGILHFQCSALDQLCDVSGSVLSQLFNFVGGNLGFLFNFGAVCRRFNQRIFQFRVYFTQQRVFGADFQ